MLTMKIRMEISSEGHRCISVPDALTMQLILFSIACVQNLQSCGLTRFQFNKLWLQLSGFVHFRFCVTSNIV